MSDKAIVVFCEDGTREYYLLGDVSHVNATIEMWRNYPVSGKLTVFANDFATVGIVLEYGVGNKTYRVDLAPGNNMFYIPPAIVTSSGWYPLQRVSVVHPTKGVVASSSVTMTGSRYEYTQHCFPSDAPKAAFLYFVGDNGVSYSYHVSLQNTEACTLKPLSDGHYSAVSIGNSIYISNPDGVDVANKLRVAYLTPMDQPATATAASITDWLNNVAGAVVSFFSSIPSAVGNALSNIPNVVQAISDSVTSVGASVVSTAKSAIDWAANTKVVEFGPFSISVLDVALMIGTVFIPVGAGAVAARLGVQALTKLGVGLSTASKLSYIIGGATAGVVAYIMDTSTGAGREEAIIDAVATGALVAVPPFLRGWKKVATITAMSLAPVVPVFLSGDKPISEVPNEPDNKADGALAYTLNKLCFDPDLSVMPYTACKQAASGSPMPVASITSITPSSGNTVVSKCPTIRVRNISNVSGTFKLKAGNNSIDISLAPDEEKQVTVCLNSGPNTVELYYGDVLIDKREIYVQPEEVNISDLLETVMVVSVFSSLIDMIRD